MLSYQDFLAKGDREAFLAETIDEYRASERYTRAAEADLYYAGENPALMGLASRLDVGGGYSVDLTAAIRTPSGIFKRLIIQLCQSVWAYGVQLESKELKAKLGRSFDKIAEGISKKAALHGVCYGFWNYDRLQAFNALEYFPLKDERSGEDRAGIRFWQIGSGKPQYIQLFETDGFSEYVRPKGEGKAVPHEGKRPYTLAVRKDALSEEVVSGENYGVLPILPMYANDEQRGELSRPIKSKIDLMDFVLSAFGDSVMRTKVIYWILQNFSGQTDELISIMNEIGRLGIVAPNDDAGADARLVDLPFGAVQFALDKLEKGIYLDFMGMRLEEITGNNLTNVAIQTAQHNLALKVSDFEWQAFDFVQRLLALQGVFTENIRFKKKTVSNDLETVRMLSMCRADLDLRTALEKNPLVEPDEVETIVKRKEAERAANDL